LIEALPVAFPDGVPAGTFAADLHYLDKLAPAPSSHAEWLAMLHLLALSQGDPERAEALIRSAGPLPWRTVWTDWRAPGRLHTPGPHVDAVEDLWADTATSSVTSLSANGEERIWDASSGRPVTSDNPDNPDIRDDREGREDRDDREDREDREDRTTAPAGSPSSRAAVWEAEPSWNIARLRLTADPDVSLVVQAPTVQAAAGVGALVVLGGDRGLYAIEPEPGYKNSHPLRPLPAVGPRGKITPRPFDEAAARPTRARLLDVFSARTAPTLTTEQLPAGLTHEPTRRFLSEVGFPAVSDFYGLDTHHLLDTGLMEHTWEGGEEFETPVGDGPFYRLGTWIGGILLLDGPTGRVLRQSRPGAVDDREPGDPLAGSSLASFVGMVCLQWEYMLAYSTSGGLDGADLLAELTAWLTALDPAAAATRNWGHVLDPDNFPYL